MHTLKALIMGLCAVLLAGCSTKDNSGNGQETKHLLTVKNNAGFDLNNAVVALDISTAGISANEIDWNRVALSIDNNSIPTQTVDDNDDGKADELLMQLSIGAGESSTLEIGTANESTDAPKSTHAEISIKEGGEWKDRVYEGGDFVPVQELHVPPEHTDHSYYIRYEGPGWESEKVGYRFYLDWRNAIDIFGKTKDDLVLDQVGLDGFDSYHEMADWGMDILKVGSALGIGALGCWSEGKALRMSQTDSVHCAIPEDGALQSTVRTTYYGWATPYGKTDVVSDLSIRAGERETKHSVSLKSSCDSLCTGIVKHPAAEVIEGKATEGWNYLATWGKQSLAEDMLGMAIFYHTDDLLAVGEDEFNEIVVLRPPTNGQLEYYFSACWEKEENGIRTKANFIEYLNETTAKFNNPAEIQLQAD